MAFEYREFPRPEPGAAIEARVLLSARDLSHALLQVYAYLQPPGSLDDDETYRVDLSRRSLTILYGKQPAFDADVQVLGAYDRSDGAWLWPRANSSLRPDAFEGFFSKLSDIEDCRALLEPDKFLVREALIFPFDAWLAREAGCFGAYPALFDGGLFVFLALEPPVGRKGFALRAMNCCFCYRGGNA